MYLYVFKKFCVSFSNDNFFNNITVVYFTLEFEKPIIIASIRKTTVATLVVKKLPVLLIGKNSKKTIKKKGTVRILEFKFCL